MTEAHEMLQETRAREIAFSLERIAAALEKIAISVEAEAERRAT
jgi:hypothetical protein